MGNSGLRYDREWAIVDSSGSTLTQKHVSIFICRQLPPFDDSATKVPKMALIKPHINLASNVLTLEFPDLMPISIKIEARSSAPSVQVRVCGDQLVKKNLISEGADL